MRLLLTALSLSCVLAGCRSDPSSPQAPAPSQPADALAWPTLFLEPAVLVAREVTIEGPPGLLDHVALTVDQRVHAYEVRTVPEGLLQELTFKPGQTAGVLRGFLDQLEIAAEVRLRVLERPGRAPLSVVARGEVFWQRPGEPEFRGESLRLAQPDPR